jgi:diguanylate cyclase (GGDEF)-like protein
VCPHLRDRPDGPCSAICVPVTIAGKSIAVLHATGEDGTPPDSNLIEVFGLIGRKSGDRLGTLRAFARTEAQAHTDPLTGLLNRRSLEREVQEFAEDGRSYVVAYGDIDHFKQLNDLHGHDTGDRALRLFSRVLRDSVRPSDLPARYGGEEFVIVLPDCSVEGAVAVVERVREHLALNLSDGQLPGFTVSFGVAASTVNSLFSETVEIADHALLRAKSEGRNRVVTAPTPKPPTEGGSQANDGDHAGRDTAAPAH